MQTSHRVVVGDARRLDDVATDAVELVVTSPPYPMIEMWDDLFATLNPAVRDRLEDGDGEAAFRLMHAELGAVWEEVARVLAPGGIACINVGDATRTVDGGFRVYPNHAAVIEAFRSLGFQPLPDVLWRKPANGAAKFMGSGMLPPNAYVTLEHEYILVFRNGETPRRFPSGAERRYESAYFWEERNEWFSDVWLDVRGRSQALDHDALRDRTAAFPVELPYRLVNMYSVYGDTVLDPFWGTGTTSIAAMAAGRDSIGYELDPAFAAAFDERVDRVAALTEELIHERLRRHRAFVRRRAAEGNDPQYRAVNYDFPVTTEQERHVQFYAVDAVHRRDGEYVLEHAPVADAEPRGGDGGESEDR